MCDHDAEKEIADYVEAQARDETVQHVERVTVEYVMGTRYEIWDVTQRPAMVVSVLTGLP